tara:strand:+ start:502 stop:699 length:198 start_codon:yes stop_codon:yes gene_type:complete
MIFRSGLTVAAFVGQLTVIMGCTFAAFSVEPHSSIHEALRYGVATALFVCPLFPLFEILERHLIL